MSTQNRTEKLTLILLLLVPIFSAIISMTFQVSALWSVILFFMLPSLILSVVAYKYILRSIIFSIVASLPVIIVIDYVAQNSAQWLIPHSILSFRLFGIVTLEVALWALFNFYFVIMFYEYFLDKYHNSRLIGSNFKYLAIIVISLISVFSVILFVRPELLIIPYFYLLFGLICILVPTIVEFFRRPEFAMRFLKVAGYFFYLTLFYEVAALKLDWWRFPSKQFVGWITFANITFPIEELVFWILLFALAILTAFDAFDSDRKLIKSN